MTSTDQSWVMRAACAEVEPDQLFGKGAEQRDARTLCFTCPVRMECLAEALDSESSFGVWGGLTERERRAPSARLPRGTRRRAPWPILAPAFRLMTCDTVVTDTPARSATCFIVTLWSPPPLMRMTPHPFVEPLSRP